MGENPASDSATRIVPSSWAAQFTSASCDFIHDVHVEKDSETDEWYLRIPSLGEDRVSVARSLGSTVIIRRKKLKCLRCFGENWVPWNELTAASGMARQLLNYRIMNSPGQQILRIVGDDMQLFKKAAPSLSTFGTNAAKLILVGETGLPNLFAARLPPVPPTLKTKLMREEARAVAYVDAPSASTRRALFSQFAVLFMSRSKLLSEGKDTAEIAAAVADLQPRLPGFRRGSDYTSTATRSAIVCLLCVALSRCCFSCCYCR